MAQIRRDTTDLWTPELAREVAVRNEHGHQTMKGHKKSNGDQAFINTNGTTNSQSVPVS